MITYIQTHYICKIIYTIKKGAQLRSFFDILPSCLLIVMSNESLYNIFKQFFHACRYRVYGLYFIIEKR